jgi:hypothetical protein
MRARLVLVPLLLLLAAVAARADEFVAGTEDVPLMPGLVLIKGSDLVFDKPEGRIVEAQTQGALSRAKVQAFYASSLPQLGWKKIGVDQWRRDAERLKLDFRGEDGHLTVGFTLSPQ